MVRGTISSSQEQTAFPDLCLRREQAGVSLEQIADTTKISIRFLRAIEARDYDQLPGGIFTVSYLRQYAAAIGMEETELLAHYRAKVAGGAEAASSPARSLWRKLAIQHFLIEG